MSANENGKSQGDALYSYDSFTGRGPRKEPGETHFLWWCAGAYQPLLKECPSEQSKYAGLGGVLLATFVLAALSAGYAIYSVFNAVLPAILFALIWGAVIFNFDRFLVSTMRKYGVSRSKQLWMALPRIALALLIGFTIARPLELKIFEKEIDVQIVRNRHQKMLLNDSLLALEDRPALTAAMQARDRLLSRRSALEDTLHRLQQDYVQEADGTGGSLRRGIDKLTRLKQDAFQGAQARTAPELQEITRGLHEQDSIIGSIRTALEGRRQGYESLVTADVGFLERNKALSDLSDREGSVYWANLLISLLIILIETGPILSKLIMPTGPYDLALAQFELLHMARSEDRIREEKELVFDRKQRIYKEKKAVSEELLQKLTALQKKKIAEEINKWENNEEPAAPKQSLDELTRQIRTRYDFQEKDLL